MRVDAKVPFKIEKFTKIPPKITAKGLENTQVDVKRKELKSAQ